MSKELEEGIQKAVKKMIQDTILYGTGGAETPTGILNGPTAAAATVGNGFNIDQLNNTIEEIYKNRVEAEADPKVKRGEVLVVNHEIMRQDLPWHKLRGKTIYYNPADLKIKKALEERGIHIKEADHENKRNIRNDKSRYVSD